MEMDKAPVNLTESELSQVSGGADNPSAKYAIGERLPYRSYVSPGCADFGYGTVTYRMYVYNTWQYMLTTDSGELTGWLNESSLGEEPQISIGGIIMK